MEGEPHVPAPPSAMEPLNAFANKTEQPEPAAAVEYPLPGAPTNGSPGNESGEGEDDAEDDVGDEDNDMLEDKPQSPSDSQQNTPSGVGVPGGLATSKMLTSRYRGVCWNKKNKRWQAAINTQGKYLYLGSYTSEEQAARAFDLAAVKLRGPRAKLNFMFTDYLDKDGTSLIDEHQLDVLTGAIKDGQPKKVIRRRRPRARRNMPTPQNTVNPHQLLSLLGIASDPPGTKQLGSRMADAMQESAAQHELLQKAALLVAIAQGNSAPAGLHSDPGMAKTLSSLGDILRNLGSTTTGNELQLSTSHLLESLGGGGSLQSAGHNMQPLLMQQSGQQQHHQHHHHHHHQVVDLQRHMIHASNVSPPPVQHHEAMMMHAAAQRNGNTGSSTSHGTGQLAISSIEALLPNSTGDMQCLIYRSIHSPDRLSCAVISTNGVHELGAYDSLADAQQAGLATMKLLEKLCRIPGAPVSSSGRMAYDQQQQLEAAVHQANMAGGGRSSNSGGMVQLSLLHGAAGGRSSPDAPRSPRLLMLAPQGHNSMPGLLGGYEGGMREQDSAPSMSYSAGLLMDAGHGGKRRYTWEDADQQPEPKRMAAPSHQVEGQQLLSVALGAGGSNRSMQDMVNALGGGSTRSVQDVVNALGGGSARGVQDVVQSLLHQANLLRSAPSQA